MTIGGFAVVGGCLSNGLLLAGIRDECDVGAKLRYALE
jgi:hypothetical protein